MALSVRFGSLSAYRNLISPLAAFALEAVVQLFGNHFCEGKTMAKKRPPCDGRRMPLDFSLLRYFQRIINFDTQIANSAFDLCMSK